MIAAIGATARPTERHRFRLNRLRSPSFCWSMIISENRFPLFRIML